MTEIDEISARLTVLETVVRQLITHMAVRTEDPAGWVETRKTLALSVIDPEKLGFDGLLYGATEAFFDQPEIVVRDYGAVGKSGTGQLLARS